MFFADAQNIFGCDPRTGRPLWVVGDGAPEPAERDDLLIWESDLGGRGEPRSLTIDDGLLFVRVDIPPEDPTERRRRAHQTALVALDVGEAEGLEMWRLVDDELAAGASFAGPRRPGIFVTFSE